MIVGLTMPRPITAILPAATVFVVLMLLFAGWQRGFSEGARQATDQILAEHDQTLEVVRLRAQLEEQRRAQDSISNMVVAAFAAGVTVLAVVNIGALLFAQQNYDRDKDALKTVLVQDAKALDQVLVENWTSTLARKDQEFREYVNQTFVPIETRLGHIEARLNQIGMISQSASDTAGLLLAQQIEDSGDKASAEDAHIWAAENYARAAATHALSSRKYWGTFLVAKVIRSLAKVEPSDKVTQRTLDEIVNNLQILEAAPPPDEPASRRIATALAMVQRMRDSHEFQDEGEVPEMPPTSPSSA